MEQLIKELLERIEKILRLLQDTQTLNPSKDLATNEKRFNRVYKLALKALAQEKKHFEECIKPGFNGDLNNMFTLVEKCSDASNANAIYRKKPIKVLCSPSDMNDIVDYKKDFSKYQQTRLAIIPADKVKFSN